MKRWKIGTQLTLLAVSTVTIVAALILYAYDRYAAVIQDSIHDNNMNLMQQLTRAIDADANASERIMNAVAYNQTTQEYLLGGDALAKAKANKTLSGFLLDMSTIRDGDYLDIVILRQDGDTFSRHGLIEPAARFAQRLRDTGEAQYSDVELVKYRGVTFPCIIAGLPVYSTVTERFGERIGTVVMLIETQALSKHIAERLTNEKQELLLVDRAGQIAASSHESVLGEAGEPLPYGLPAVSGREATSRTIQDGLYRMQTLPASGYGLTVVNVVPDSEWRAKLGLIRKQEFLVLLAAIGLLAIPFTHIIGNIIRPLRRLLRFMGAMKAGGVDKLKQRVVMEGYFEARMVANEFNAMLDELHRLTTELLEARTNVLSLELEHQKAEYAYLKSQINPHFLYNALESLKGLAAVRKVPDIREMAKALADIFRYSVEGEDIVALERELRMIRSYLQVQHVKFQDRFEAHYGIDDTALRCLVPKMILQPIVENAFFHGLEPQLKKGRLTIEAGIEEGNALVILVKDNGVGMSEDMLEKIGKRIAAARDREQTGEDKTGHSNGLGLPNVAGRIRLLCGGDYGMTIRSGPGTGTEVRLRLPARREDDV